VGTPDATRHRPGMTRRENIDLNLMEDAAYYCYEQAFSGHSITATPIIPGAWRWLLLVSGVCAACHRQPYSIYAMLANNATATGLLRNRLGYALHAATST